MALYGASDGVRDASVAGRAVPAVVALVGLALAAMIAGLGYAAWREYRGTIEQIEARAANAVHTAEEHVRWLVEAGMQALNRIDDALAADPGAAAMGEVRDLQPIVRSLPKDTFIWVFDARGDSILKTDPRDLRVNVADRDHFRALADGADWQISPLLTGRVGDRRVFTIGRRLERDEEFAGAAIVVIPADLMSEFYATLDLGPRSSISMIRDDGWIVARHPQLPETMNLTGHVLFTEHLPRAPMGLYHSERSPADGEARVVAYRRVEDLPLISIVGISKTAALEGLWSRLRILAGAGTGVFVVLLLLSGWVVALLRRDERNRRKLERSLEQNEMLLREVHHRVKNNLQIVSSLIHLQPGSREAKAEMTRRIAAMAAVHEQIYRADRFTEIDLPEYIRVVCDGLREAFGRPVRMRFELAPLGAHIDTALPLGLILSETVSNALKHAFPADGRAGGGTITVALERRSGHEAVLRVSDDGVGFDPAAPPSSGLGMRLLGALSAQIGGGYRFDSDGAGTSFVLVFPLKGGAAATDEPDGRRAPAPDAGVVDVMPGPTGGRAAPSGP